MAKSIFIDIEEPNFHVYALPSRGEEITLLGEYPYSRSFDALPANVSAGVEKCYLSLPSGMLNFRVLDLPFGDKDRIREVLPFELSGVIMGGPANVIFDALVLGQYDGKYSVLAVYIEKSLLSDILEGLKRHGIDPVIVTSVALRAALKDFSPEKLLSPPSFEKIEKTALIQQEILNPSVNLRREEFSYTRDIRKTQKGLRVTAILALLIAVVISADFIYKIVENRNEISALKNEMRKEYLSLFPGEKNIVNELYQLKSHMKEMGEKEELYVGVRPLDPLTALSTVDLKGVAINELSIDRLNVTIKGEASSLSEIQSLQQALKGKFSDSAVTDSRETAQGKMSFTIMGRYSVR